MARIEVAGHYAGMSFLFTICVGFPGLLGIGLRKFLYPKVFEGISSSSYIGKHVTLRCPSQINLGKEVMIDDYTQLIANSKHQDAIKIASGGFIRSQAMIVAGPPEGFVQIGEKYRDWPGHNIVW